MFAHPEPVTVQTATTATDPYSGEVESSWDFLPSTRTERCAVADGGSTESREANRNPVDADFDLIFDYDPAITTENRVVVRGHVCDVVGFPFAWRSPFTGWTPGVVVQVKVREG